MQTDNYWSYSTVVDCTFLYSCPDCLAKAVEKCVLILAPFYVFFSYMFIMQRMRLENAFISLHPTYAFYTCCKSLMIFFHEATIK